MLKIILGFALLAGAVIANKIALLAMPPMLLVAVRMLVAGLLLLVLARRSVAWTPWATIKKDFGRLLLCSLFTMLITSVAKAFALRGMMPAKAAFIAALDPFVTAILVYVLLGQKLTLSKWLGVLVAFSGALALCCLDARGTLSLNFFLLRSWPELAALLAVVTGRYGWLLMQQQLKKERYQPLQLNGIVMLMAGLIATPISLLTEQINWAGMITPTTLTALAFTVLVGNVIAYTAVAYFLKWHSAVLVSIAGFSVPVFVALFGWLLLSDVVTPAFVGAAALIFFGVGLFYRGEIG